MDNSNQKIFLDKLNLNSFIFILKNEPVREIILLDKQTRLVNFLCKVLFVLGYKFNEESFFMGHLKSEEGESVYFDASNKARSLAVKAAKQIIDNNYLLNEISEYYKYGTLHLRITKDLVWHIKYWTSRILTAKSLAKDKDFKIYLKSSDLVSNSIISNSFPEVNLVLYNQNFLPFSLFFTRLRLIFNLITSLIVFPGFNFRKNNKIVKGFDKPGLLVLQEDSISSDTSYRSQPHWISDENKLTNYNTYIITSWSKDLSLSEVDKRIFKSNNIFLIKRSDLNYAYNLSKKDPSLKDLKKYKRKLIAQIFKNNNFQDLYYALKTAIFLKQSEFMAAITLFLNIKVFLYRESYLPLTDAMNIAKIHTNTRTFAYQYSNMGVVSPIMMNTADKMIIFSKNYINLFKNNDFSSLSFIESGYLYNNFNNDLKTRASSLRSDLLRKDVKFIIGFFDESVQYDKWGLVSESDHLSEIYELAKAVLNDLTLAVIIKTQYIKNSPGLKYKNDNLISKAILTGRFLVLNHGFVRNDILPAEVALVSDITIGHKFGATASLESVVVGTRAVLINNYNLKTCWDHLYIGNQIIFSSMRSTLNVINEFRNGNKDFEKLGLWDSILHNFISDKNLDSISHLNKLLEDEFKLALS